MIPHFLSDNVERFAQSAMKAKEEFPPSRSPSIRLQIFQIDQIREIFWNRSLKFHPIHSQICEIGKVCNKFWKWPLNVIIEHPQGLKIYQM